MHLGPEGFICTYLNAHICTMQLHGPFGNSSKTSKTGILGIVVRVDVVLIEE